MHVVAEILLCKNCARMHRFQQIRVSCEKSRFPDLLETLVVKENERSCCRRLSGFASRGSQVRPLSRPPILSTTYRLLPSVHSPHCRDFCSDPITLLDSCSCDSSSARNFSNFSIATRFCSAAGLNGSPVDIRAGSHLARCHASVMQLATNHDKLLTTYERRQI